MADRRWLPRRGPTDRSDYGRQVSASGALSNAETGRDEARVRWAFTRQQQMRVWAYRREIPELAYGIGFYEACFSRIRLTLAVEEDDGRRRPVFDEDGKPLTQDAPQALEALRAIQSPVGGQTQVMRSIGGCLAAVGECHLVGVDDDSMKSKQAFEAYSPSQFYLPATGASQTQDGKKVNVYHKISAPGQQPTDVRDDKALIIRIWQPDTEYNLLPWAPALSMLDVLDELVLLTREVAAAVKSRLAMAGILLIADDIDFPEREDAEPGSPEQDPFTADLIEVASTAIRDKSSVAGFIPFISRVPYDRVKDGFHLIEFGRDWDKEASAKRNECFDRFARGFDLPYEVLKGFMGTTYSNAAQVSADLYRTHVEPKAQIATDALTRGYLRSVLPGTSLIIDHDATDLVVHPDQIGDWEKAFDRKAVSFASYRNKLGATEEDAPDDEELVLRLLLDIAQHTRVAPGERISQVVPTVAELEGEVGLTDTPTDTGAPPAGPPAGPPASAPPTNGNGNGKAGGAGVEVANDPAIKAAMEVEIRRVMQRVGARLRSKVSGNSGLRSLVQDVADSEVAATLGFATVTGLMSETELLGREFDVLAGYVEERLGRELAQKVKAQAIASVTTRMYAPTGAGR